MKWRIEEGQRRVECRLDELQSQAPIVLPWGRLWLGEELGGGQVVWVEASEAFELILHGERVTLSEHVIPGRNHFLVTHLDRTDVAGDQ